MRDEQRTISEKVELLGMAVARLINQVEGLEFEDKVTKATLVDLAIRAGIGQEEFIEMIHANHDLIERMMDGKPDHKDVVADAIKKAREAS